MFLEKIMGYRKRPDHFNPYSSKHQGQYDTYYRSEKFKELIELKNARLAKVNMENEGDPDNPNAYAYYKSSYDGSVKAILPYLRKPADDGKTNKRRTQRDSVEVASKE